MTLSTPAPDAAGLLDLLIEQVVDYAIFVIDPTGNIASWNPGAQRIKGYSREEIIGKPYALFFSEEDQKAGKPWQILSQASTQGRFQEEGWRVRKDGARFWASVAVTALRDEHGVLKGFAKITRDLTERHLAEEAARHAAEERAARRQAELDEQEVRRSRDKLQLILESIVEGVTVQTPDGQLSFANDAAARLCGFESAQSMMARPASEALRSFEVFREDGSPFPLDQLPGRLALHGKTSSVVVRFRTTHTAEDRWAFVSGAPLFDAAGAVEFSVSVFRELTEQRRTELAWQFLAEASVALGSSLDYHETLTQLAELAVPRIADWCTVEVLDSDGELEQLAVAHVDPAKRDLAREWRRRWPPARDSITYRVVNTGHPDLVSDITDAMIEAGATAPEQRQVALQLGLRSVMTVPLIVGQKPFGVVSFLTAESGRRYEASDLILAREIALRASLAVENARAYTEARTAVQTRDNFLAIASHELRTPLSGLTALMSSLERAATRGTLTSLGAEALKTRMQRAERQTRQLASLVDRLLDVSRLSTRDLLLERVRANLSDVVREVVDRYETLAQEAGSRIELAVSGPVIGQWDITRMDQVVSNLVGNAVKYSRGAAIRVSLTTTGLKYARLTVRDEGPGIAIEDHERVFGQYERAASDENASGMGLGLWLVRRIVTAHGGTVTLKSSPGAGAEFTIVLPRNQSDDESEKPLESAPS